MSRKHIVHVTYRETPILEIGKKGLNVIHANPHFSQKLPAETEAVPKHASHNHGVVTGNDIEYPIYGRYPFYGRTFEPHIISIRGIMAFRYFAEGRRLIDRTRRKELARPACVTLYYVQLTSRQVRS